MIEKLVLDSSSRDSIDGKAGAYYNYEPGHKYAMSTVNTEPRNKFNVSEMNIYELEANRLRKQKKQNSFKIKNGVRKQKELSRSPRNH